MTSPREGVVDGERFESGDLPPFAANEDGTVFQFLRGWFEDGDPLFADVIRRVTLESSDLYRVIVAVEHDAGAFAEDLGRADARATRAENVGAENGARGAGHVRGHDLLDESGDVDAGRAGANAGGVEAKKAAPRFHSDLLSGVAGRDVGEIALEFRGG